VSEEEDQEEGFAVRMHFVGAEQVPILYASHIFVRFEEHVFHVTFAQQAGPLELHLDRETLEREGLPTQVVARLAIPVDHWRRMLEVAQGNYANWEKAVAAGFTTVVEAGEYEEPASLKKGDGDLPSPRRK
jgi:hypothetical protein